MNLIILDSLSIIIVYFLIDGSLCCSIFSGLNCSCFQSISDSNVSISDKIIYSYLYCQGKQLNETTLEYSSQFDHQSEKRFRTVSIEFLIEDDIEIRSNYFDPLGELFVERDVNDPIEISLRFNGFHRIQFHNQSITSVMFGKKHQKKYLSMYLIPSRQNLTEVN